MRDMKKKRRLDFHNRINFKSPYPNICSNNEESNQVS